MRALISAKSLEGEIPIPPSKSHTIRRLIMAALTDDVSRIEGPLDSLDTKSCAEACRILGADITEEHDGQGKLTEYTVHGVPGVFSRPDKALTIDVGNSGTTLFLALAAASLFPQPFTFTGDEQIAKRSAAPLLDALAGLGVAVTSNNGCTPITIRGPWKGGRVSVSCPTSQYLSALLIAAPLAPAGVITEIDVPLLNEKPYVEMTLAYLEKQGLLERPGSAGIGAAGISHATDFSFFRISGGGAYTPINGPVPGDFSSAAFPAAAAAISGGTVTLLGLDPGDTQGDKIFFNHLARMGCNVQWESVSGRDVTVSRSGPLRGGTFDLNATPDMLPVMAALGAYAEGETALTNVAHARIKETDRIAVMAAELRKLGIICEEKPDGLVVRGKTKDLKGLIENLTPVTICKPVSGEGFSVFNAYSESSDGWRQLTLNWIMSILPQSIQMDDGEVLITKSRIRDLIAHGKGPLKILTMPHLSELLKNGVLFHTEINRGFTFYNYAHPLLFEEKLYFGIMVVREDFNGKRFYDNEFIIKKSTGEPANTSGSTVGTAKHLTHPSIGSILHNVLAVKLPICLDGHGDHRIVMALACAALGFSGPVEIAGAEAADVTYPGFLELLAGRCYT